MNDTREQLGVLHFLRRYVTLMFTVVSITVLYRVTLVMIMLGYSVIHTNRYTYWNYVGQTVFYVLLWLSYLWKSTYLRDILTVFALPIVIGSVICVYAYIIIVLQLDDGKPFLDASTLAGGALTLGSVHTFDHIIHTLTALDLFVVLTSGYVYEARIKISVFYKSLAKRQERAIFNLYYFLVPLLPFAFYACFFNPFTEYSTPYPEIVPFSFGIVVYLLVVWWSRTMLTTRTYGHFENLNPIE